ncbi:hypothetical protein LguiB_035084 [Lonicera macranthoides]
MSAHSHPTDSLGRTRASKSRTVLQNLTENDSKSNGSINQDNALEESVVAEESKGDLANPVCEKAEETRMPVERRRFTRSALKRKVEGLELADTTNVALEGIKDDEGALKRKVEDSELADTTNVVVLEGVKDEVVADEGNGGVDVSTRGRAKKIKRQRPTTVKELLRSGLLEGCSVFYNAGKEEIALRGTVKDSGILCSCSLCKGSRVITASQFELHACAQYRHAARFICLENGKNLLEVMDACLYSSLETLEETIQDVIASLPVKQSIICGKCKDTTCADWCKMPTNTAGAKARSSETTPKSLRSALVPKSPKSVPTHILSQNKRKGKMVSESVLHSSSPKSDAKKRVKITKKDQRMHWLVFEEDGLPDGTEVAYYSHGKKLLEGYKKGAGIFCLCCNTEVASILPKIMMIYASFVRMAGIYCYVMDALECASLSSIPRGKWYCKYCENMFQRERFVKHNANAVAAGRVSGVDPIEQITKRCIRIVKNPQKDEVIACVLCRGADINKSGFGPSTVILCDQCEKEYHVGCLKKNKMADLKELPKGKWFCCIDCGRIYSALQNLLTRGAERLPNSQFDIIKKKLKDKGVESITDFDVSWRLMSGKIASPETRLLLSEAVALFHENFDPIVDSATGRDFIPSMVYGSSIVSAGVLRVFGRGMAELPLVATASENQGKGYFQLLFSCIEKLLAFLNVTKLVLPAADEAGSIWTDRFGFKSISPAQLSEYRKHFGQLMTFQGTSMLEKPVPQCRIIH